MSKFHKGDEIVLCANVNKRQKEKVMAIWPESILSELKGVTEEQEKLAEPDESVGLKENIFGTASADIRKLWFLVKEYKKRAVEITIEIFVKRLSGKELEEKRREAIRLDRQASVLEDIFWISVRNSSPELWDKPYVGIRKGWKIISSEIEDGLVGKHDLIFIRLPHGRPGDPPAEVEPAPGIPSSRRYH